MPRAADLPFARGPLAAAETELLHRLERNIAELQADSPKPLSARGRILSLLIERRERLLRRGRIGNATTPDPE